MEWFGFGLVAALVIFWWLGRDPAPPAPQPDAGAGQTSPGAAPISRTAAGAGMGLVGAEVLRRATDMNDPDGTFMDGYVAGRLTERAEARDEMDALAARQAHDELDTSYRWSGSDDETWEDADDDMHDTADDDLSDDW